MSDTLTAPPPTKRRRPRLGRAPHDLDVATGVLAFTLEVLACLWQAWIAGWAAWGAQGSASLIHAAQTTSLRWSVCLLVAALVLVGLAALFRAPWTAVSQVLAAVVLAVMLVSQLQSDGSIGQPAPTPTPSVPYSPCYSGSGTCG